MRASLRLAVFASVSLALAAPASSARAQPPAPDLMARLATYAAGFEAMKTRASYSVEGRLETLDGDGKADSVKEMRARVTADGARAHFEVLRYVEDGEDKTAEAREKAAESEKKREKEKKDKKDIHMPFLATEQARYVFDQAETDPADPARVRVTFVPTSPAEDTIEGSAWVDARSGTLLTAGFKLSRTTMFVDYVHVTVEFGAPTPLGPPNSTSVSKVTVDGKGGVLFFRKRFRAEATLSGYRVL